MIKQTKPACDCTIPELLMELATRKETDPEVVHMHFSQSQEVSQNADGSFTKSNTWFATMSIVMERGRVKVDSLKEVSK